ncbi:cell division protein FtsB [Arthrobacter sp. SLBN-100]|uniref:FtsB family cell division protein n=1 Tax=Arthrobacter sp. SLBN-100 TaxID=2768450 RepID=UPI0011531ED1|nr:septum formation initiator family protein [Arthrobacter sp. SLBN-100]TQJ69872.1 cell division protein FtsB [Arthrobacter sp. SLBN-100]
MATRRPKVPKVASPRSGPPQATHETTDGADVIRADFGSGKGKPGAGPAGHEASAPIAGAARDNRRTALADKAPGPHPAKGSHQVKGFDAGRKGSGAEGTSPAAGTGAAEEQQQPVPAKAFSGRMLALAVVMIAITIMLAPTVKIFFDKRAEIAALNADIAAREAEGNSLRQQVSRWQDPNYVKQQARDRINMVMPGETGYWVFGSDLPAGESSSPTGAAAQDPADLPWVDSLWESITRAATD